jgi:hypothetical protein
MSGIYSGIEYVDKGQFTETEKAILSLDADLLYSTLGDAIVPTCRYQGLTKDYLSGSPEVYPPEVIAILNGVTTPVRQILIKIHGNICANCRCEKKVVADHIVAVCNGGGGCWLSNYQLLCGDCHNYKTREDIKYARKNKRNAITEHNPRTLGKRTTRMYLKVTPETKKKWTEAAKSRNMSLSNFIVTAALRKLDQMDELEKFKKWLYS